MHLVSFSVADDNVLRPGLLLPQAGPVIDLCRGLRRYARRHRCRHHRPSISRRHYPIHKLSEVRLHAPLSNPPRIFAIGLNYRDHAAESKMALPSAPVVFFKMPTAIIGPGDAIVLPRNSERARLRGRTGLRHRQGRLSHSCIGVARARLRLHHRQRCERPRCAAGHFAMVAGEKLPYFLPHGPGHRHRR